MNGDQMWFRRRNRTDGMGRDGTRVRTRHRPRLEDSILEDRRLLTKVITVTSPADGGPGTLRQAIVVANATTTEDVKIEFKLKATEITLSTGQLELSNTAQPIAIVGPGADRLAVDGNGASRVFEISSGVTASISGMSVTGGLTSDDGAGLLNQGDLTLTGVTVSHNRSPAGGGLDNLGKATLVGCTFADNTGSFGGGILNVGTATLQDCSFVDNTAGHYGGGIENYGAATLVGCSFVGNTAGDGAGGGFAGNENLFVPSKSSVLINCSFIDNTSGGFGGGLALFVSDGGPHQVVDCVFRDNRAAAGGGGLDLEGFNSPTVTATVTGCLIEGNSDVASADVGGGAGGGLSVSEIAVTVTDCIIRNNSAGGVAVGGVGGGVFNGGTLTMTGVTISGNSAGSQGGGLSLSGTTTLTDCTISGNSANQGGGLLMFGRANTALVACTVSGNSATTPGGGGGLYSYPYYGYDPRVTLTDTIVAGNRASDGASDFARDYVGPVTGSYNLIGTGGSGGLTAAGHNLLNVADPGLTPLGDYGGPTQTVALQPNSPARHAGTAVSGVTTDQRGFSLDRPVDIGAFQSQPGPLVVDTAIDGLGSTLGRLSLRQAVNLADVLTGGATITFDKSTFAKKSVIALTKGPLVLSNATGPVTITGPGLGRLAVSGGGAGRVFQVDKGASAALSGLTITGGVTAGDGGGLLNQGSVALAGVAVVGNAAANGGGIANSGTAVIAGSAIDGNAASVNGGGIFNTGFLNLTRSDLAANSAATNGGGLYNRGTAALVYCTVNDNAASAGGGVYADPAGQPVVLLSTKVARNKGGNTFGQVIVL
jgi:hypothetical protein